ncbi:MAG: hypothetical protein EOO71_40290 [Myxococcaceae bacterium]|nr:MAG: hypothetical protein EOO71_40290 [Myxococcaceae bacterium]
MAFRVQLITIVPFDIDVDHESDVFVHRIIELPFPPFKGLSVSDGPWHSSSITEVHYNIDHGVFDAYTDDGRRAREKLPFDDAVAVLKANGWPDEDETLI